MLGALRPAVYAIDKDQPVGTIQPLEEIMADSIARQRFAMLLLSVFSVVALVIAAVGIYGVMAYSVVQRTGEFGIRMALGAQQRDVLRLVLTQGGKLIGLGLVIGLRRRWPRRARWARCSSTPALTIRLRQPHHAAAGRGRAGRLLLSRRRATKVNPIEALRTE